MLNKIGNFFNRFLIILFEFVLPIFFWLAVLGILNIPHMIGKSCELNAIKMEMQYDYGFIQGCMIKTDVGKWIPLANYRIVNNKS